MRVVVTQAAGGGSRLPERLREAGFEVIACPLIRVEPLEGPRVSLERYDWLVLTSARSVELLRSRVEGPLPPVAAVGPGTAAALRAAGIDPAVVAERSTQEGLLEAMPRSPGRVLFAGAEGARDVLARELGADLLPLYRTVELRPERFPEAELVVLASASAARAFAAIGVDCPCVSIGPVTSREAGALGLRVVGEAGTHDADGLVRAVRLAASRLAS